MEVGKKISFLRKNKGMTQKELAEILCVTDKAISRWESGIGNPDLNSLPKIAKIFNVSVDYLLSNTNELPIDESPKENQNVIQKPLKKANKKKLFLILSSILTTLIIVGCAIGIPLSVKAANNGKMYNQAIFYMEEGKYVEAKNIFDSLNYKDSKNKAIVCNGLITLEGAKLSKDQNELSLGVQFIVSCGTDVNVHYDGNGKYIIDNQIRYDDVLNKNNYSFLVPSSSGFSKWVNQSFYYYKSTTFLYLSAVWEN